MIHLEKKCRKIRSGEANFSDKLANAGRHIKIWNLIMRHKEKNGVNTRVIRRKAKRVGLTRVLADSLPHAKLKLHKHGNSIKNSKNLHIVCIMIFYLLEKIKLRVKSLKEKSRTSEDTKKKADRGEQSIESKSNQEVTA